MDKLTVKEACLVTLGGALVALLIVAFSATGVAFFFGPWWAVGYALIALNNVRVSVRAALKTINKKIEAEQRGYEIV